MAVSGTTRARMFATANSVAASKIARCVARQSDRVAATDRRGGVLRDTVESLKRVLRIAFGFVLLGLGIVMIFTPGPGWLTIFLALGVLAAEFGWARRLLNRLKEEASRLRAAISVRDTPPSV